MAQADVKQYTCDDCGIKTDDASRWLTFQIVVRGHETKEVDTCSQGCAVRQAQKVLMVYFEAPQSTRDSSLLAWGAHLVGGEAKSG